MPPPRKKALRAAPGTLTLLALSSEYSYYFHFIVFSETVLIYLSITSFQKVKTETYPLCPLGEKQKQQELNLIQKWFLLFIHLVN